MIGSRDCCPTTRCEAALDGLEPEQITGPGGLLSQLAGRVIETALGAELTEHLGYPPGQAPPGGAGNHRNGQTAKTVQSELGTVEVRTPRDRKGSFEPQLVGKRQTRLAGLDEKILALYAGGMTVRDIAGHLQELYGIEIARDTISRVTDAVLEDIAGVAHAAAGRGLPDRLLRLPDGQHPRGPLGPLARLLSRRSGSRSTATARCSGSGGRRPRAPSSGSRS